MTVLTVNAIQKSGIADLDAVLVAATAAGDSVPSSSGLFVAMKNADASPHTLTIAAPASSSSCGNLGPLDVDPIALVVAAGDIGFLTIPAGYNDGLGSFAWTYDDDTSVTIAVFSLSPNA